jgi:hypothetical protein
MIVFFFGETIVVNPQTLSFSGAKNFYFQGERDYGKWNGKKRVFFFLVGLN